MKEFINQHFDRLAIITVLLIVAGMWLHQGNQFTEQIVRDVIIAIVAYLTGKQSTTNKQIGV